MVLFGTLLAGIAGAGEPIRLGMIGPARSDPAWVLLQMGLREAAAAYADEGVELQFLFASLQAESGLAGALERFSKAGVDAAVVMHPASATADVASRPPKLPVFWVAWAPHGVSGDRWTVDWVAWARALQVVAADLAQAPRGAVIGTVGLAEVVPRDTLDRLTIGEFWPATGAWSLRAFPEVSSIQPRDDISVLVVAQPQDLLRLDAGQRAPVVATWLDALVLHGLENGRVAAAVVPHWREAGGQILDRTLARHRGEVDGGEGEHRIGPFILARENGSAWRAFWQDWQF